MGFGNVLKKAFPFISAAASLGGPIGTMAANAVGAALGVGKVEPTEDGIGSAITSAQIKDPDALLKLQQAEESFKLQMAKLGFDDAEKLAEIAAADTANARAREIALKDKTPAVLAYTTTGGYFGLLFLNNFHALPASSSLIMPTLLESLKTVWILVMGYYFGSSKGSAEKTQILANQGNK